MGTPHRAFAAKHFVCPGPRLTSTLSATQRQIVLRLFHFGQARVNENRKHGEHCVNAGWANGHFAEFDECPLYSRKQTLIERVGMSALGGGLNRSLQHRL